MSVLRISDDLRENKQGTFNGDVWKSFVDTLTTDSTSESGVSVEDHIWNSLVIDEDLMADLVKFYHMYVVQVRDIDVVKRNLCDGISVFDVVTPSDTSWATFTFVDNFNGWKDSYEKLGSGQIRPVPNVNETRWKKWRGKTKFNDRVGPGAKDFYKKCEFFFSVVQDNNEEGNSELKEMLDRRSIEWWKLNGTVVTNKKRKAPDQVLGDKGKVQATVVNNDALLSYNKLMKNMGKESSGVPVGGDGVGVFSSMSDADSSSETGSPSSSVLCS